MLLSAAETVPADWHRLADYLRAQGMSFDPEQPIRQFAGGLANRNYLVVVDGVRAVLRRPPDGDLPPGAHDMAREHKILSRLATALPFIAPSLHYCERRDVIGVPFQLIEYRSGIGWIQSQARPGIAINPAASRLAWSAESLLPVASAASLVFTLILAALGARWALTGSEASARADQLGTEIEAIEQRIAAMQAQQSMPEGFAGVQAFIERATRLHEG
ncbi:MAG: phosphotransferase, partial [Rhizobiales bacterium]|nr:phosphotransferase [Hyphomicrobiales bacterium]